MLSMRVWLAQWLLVMSARIMRDMAQDTDTVFIHQTVQKLKGLMNIVRNANNQKTMDNIKENVLEK